MAKLTPRFKHPEQILNLGGQAIGAHNISQPVYDHLISVAPSYADFFEFIDENGNVVTPTEDEAPAVDAPVAEAKAKTKSKDKDQA